MVRRATCDVPFVCLLNVRDRRVGLGRGTGAFFFPEDRHLKNIRRELTACDADGMPDFGALLRGDPDYICVWCFDLLSINAKDLRSLPYLERKHRLENST
jgi:hypothetical protein